MTILTIEQAAIADIEKFWGNLDRSAGEASCWLWTGCVNHAGYGVMKLTRKKKYVLTHRFSCILKTGEIPSHLHVLHRCDTPGCANPSHLFLGTQAENVSDMVAKNRQSRGSKNHSKLTEEQVIEIKELRKSMSHVELAARFNVCTTTIGSITTGLKWKHVGEFIPIKEEKLKFPPMLSEEKVREIRKFGEENSVSNVASKFGIKYHRAWKILRGEAYKNII